MDQKQRNKVYRKALAHAKTVDRLEGLYLCPTLSFMAFGLYDGDVMKELPEFALFAPDDWHSDDPFTTSYYNNYVRMEPQEQYDFRVAILLLCIEMTKP